MSERSVEVQAQRMAMGPFRAAFTVAVQELDGVSPWDALFATKPTVSVFPFLWSRTSWLCAAIHGVLRVSAEFFAESGGP